MINTIKTLALVLILFGSTHIRAQSEKPFPPILGNDLNGLRVPLPEISKNRYAIIGLVTSKEAIDSLYDWYIPIADNFAWDDEIDTWFVVLMGGMNQSISMSIQKEIRDFVLEEYYEKVVIFKGNAKNARESLNIKEPTKPYFFVIDPSGNIVYKTYGKYTEEKLDEIIIAIDGEIYIDSEMD
jgi:hypothetical protein